MAADSKKKDKKPYEPRYVLKSQLGDETTYDFIQHRSTEHRTNVIESIGHLIKSCLGGGITSVNETYMRNGLWSSLAMNVFLGMAVTYCMLMLSRTAQKMYYRVHETAFSFPDLAQAVFDCSRFAKIRPYAKTARYAVDLTIMVDLFGSCACYMGEPGILKNTIYWQYIWLILVECILCIRNSECFYLHLVLHTIRGPTSFQLRKVVIAKIITDLAVICDLPKSVQDLSVRVWLACLLIPCIIITWILTLKYLAPFSIFGDVVIISVCATTMYYCLMNPLDPSTLANYKDVKGFFNFLGGCVFAMEGIGVTLPIENYLKNPKQIWIVLWCGMSVVVGLVIMNGFFGYLGWGDHTASPVTNNYPHSAWAIILRSGLLTMLYVTFALNFWLPFDLLWVYIKDRYPPEKKKFMERVWRSILALIIGLVAVIFPAIVSLMALIGSFCLSNMGFIYPALLELLVDWDWPGLGLYKWRLWKAILIILFGTVLFVVGTVLNTLNVLEESGYISTDGTTTTTPATSSVLY